MKYHYIAISAKNDGKNFASILRVAESDNLIFSLQIPGITAANIFSTRKEAEKVVDFWNKCYKKSKTFGGL
jgi:hypothetical protein|nr:MAG TPA: hypothetical protein [Caudoviricetes sp.]